MQSLHLWKEFWKINLFCFLFKNSPYSLKEAWIYPAPRPQAGCDTRTIFKRIMTGLNSEFSLSKTKELNLANYSPIIRGEKRCIHAVPQRRVKYKLPRPKFEFRSPIHMSITVISVPPCWKGWQVPCSFSFWLDYELFNPHLLLKTNIRCSLTQDRGKENVYPNVYLKKEAISKIFFFF